MKKKKLLLLKLSKIRITEMRWIRRTEESSLRHILKTLFITRDANLGFDPEQWKNNTYHQTPKKSDWTEQKVWIARMIFQVI